MDLTLIIAVVGTIGTIVNSYYISHSKTNTALAKKANAEADKIISDLKNETITHLQTQIDELRKEIGLLKQQEFIHVKEKAKLELVIEDLTKQNLKLQESLKDSHKEIKNLTEQIGILRMELNSFKNKHRIKNEQDISDSRTS